ncbi:hypothetical protein [[Acholeplasma] multilocale]|uniref:hypothetical protein n=1 Tax=[Acholeplasma] multilocale TaxID=264638 RepID=UPI000478E530|nr:hypothetical protein [[Acholeplasma] multilocale]
MEKFNEIISIERISLDLLEKDYLILKGLKDQGFETTVEFEEGIQRLSEVTTLIQVVDVLGSLFDKLAEAKQFDLAMIIQQFLQRYAYLAATNNDYLNYSDEFTAELINEDPAFTFLDVFAPFFSSQINFYVGNYINTMNNYPLHEWSNGVKDKLALYTSEVITSDQIGEKLQMMEEFTIYLQDLKNLYAEINPADNNAEKQVFLTQTNEMKIILQSLDMLVKEVLEELVGKRG